MLINLKRIGISDYIAFPGTLLLIKDFKLYESLQLHGCSCWEKPGNIEVLNTTKTRNDARLQARWSQYQEIMRPYRIMWLILSKVQIYINECSHQIGFSRTHRKTEKIIRISYLVKDILQHFLIINLPGMMTDKQLQLWRYLLAVAVFLPAILIQGQRSRILCHHITCLCIDFLCINISFIKFAFCKKLPKRLALAGYFQKQISLDSINLGVTQHTSLINIINEV